MVFNIQNEFKNLILEQDWMETESKNQALEKVIHSYIFLFQILTLYNW